MDLTGEPDGPPTKSGLSLVDYSGGFVAAISLLAGVHAARRDGVGMDCDVSLYDTAIDDADLPGDLAPQRRLRARRAPATPPTRRWCRSRRSRPSDGWIVVGCAKEKFWQRLAEVVGHPEWAEPDSPYATFAGRAAAQRRAARQLEEIFTQRTVDEWLSVLYPASIPCGPINDVAAALREEHTVARGLIVETEHPRFGTVRQLASPVRVGDERPHVPAGAAAQRGLRLRRPGDPRLDDERIAALAAAGRLRRRADGAGGAG